MATFRTSRTFDVLFLLAVTGLLVMAAVNRQAIGDKVFFLTYKPSTQTVQLATDAGLSSYGRALLYRSNPQFDDLAAVTAECDVERLGCLSSRGQTFILGDPTKPAQTIVTGAHEMLHLAYRRLAQIKKDELAPLLDQAIAAQAIGSGLNDELRSETTPEDRRDEAHSLLGTEDKNLPPELETYYKTYFSDRSKVLAATASENLDLPSR